jgi:glycosyltransferase involved in cell wall biosynthesis
MQRLDQSLSALQSVTAGHALPTLSLVTPAYNESDNLPQLYAAICGVLDPLAISWEWIVVDDHSPDTTFQAIEKISNQDARVRGIRLARNHGSHSAVRCAIARTTGEAVVILAADLQDPPELLPQLLAQWRNGSDVVWAVRANREGERKSTLLFARLYYWLMRRAAGMEHVPADGADFALIDRKVAAALGRFREANTSLLALLIWMGFSQTSIEYTKKPRLHGSSGWSLGKKLKLVVDSLTAFTFAPVRCMSYLGLATALGAFVWAGFIVRNALFGHPVEGWSSVMVAVLFLGGLQMMMMGVLGEYLWRALDEARRRPSYLIERETKNPRAGIE